MPTGQVFSWHCLTILHPKAKRGKVPKPNLSAPRVAPITTSFAERSPPSTSSKTLSLMLFKTKAWCVSLSPNSHGEPACLILVHGLAPVPPSLPAMVMISAPAFATPTAIVPTPGSETNLTFTGLLGLKVLRSYMSCAKSSIE